MFEHYENYDRYIPDVMLKKHKKHEEYLNNAYAGMTHEEIYKSKLGTVDDALALIESGDVIVNSIPGCVMGGVCIALYGFIAVSGLKMIQQVDLGKDNKLFVVSTILVTGIGGLSLTFGKITITPVAVALILGILANQILKGRSANRD